MKLITNIHDALLKGGSRSKVKCQGWDKTNWKKTQNNGYYGVQGNRGRYQSKARMWFPISD